MHQLSWVRDLGGGRRLIVLTLQLLDVSAKLVILGNGGDHLFVESARRSFEFAQVQREVQQATNLRARVYPTRWFGAA